MSQIRLGVRARCLVTGFVGIVIGIADYLNGCKQLCLKPPVKDGENKDGQWFDAPQLVYVDEGVRSEMFPNEEPPRASGGPMRDAPVGR